MTEIDLLAARHTYLDAIDAELAELGRAHHGNGLCMAIAVRLLLSSYAEWRAAVDGLEALKLRTAA